ncbi:4-oxalocrotonate tautomerase [Burkholderia sp. Bp8963]|uniref:4-oxalocrotonate tautomerase n=1 Tax=Burkholderia sp. Bp8963 TaxID=2184547 RepID=UPI000F5B12F7|nr:4-oxalocrotonate tautomerase [Burkholderia sp. Bp8963]RQS72023.1 4-oxalocrotonate tautomerase [Burkholderia sp. Bp8963]
MPLTLTLTEGVLPAGQEKVAYRRLSEAMLKWHGLTGNALMTSNVVGSIHVLNREHTFTGMDETPVVFVEWKVPSFAFTERRVQEGYFAEATHIIHEMSGGRQPKDRIFINVVHAVDGAWNFNGKAMTNAEIGAELAKAG